MRRLGWLAMVLWLALAHAGRGQTEAPAQSGGGASAADVEKRLAAVERMYGELLRRETEGRQQAERRYQELESRYESLRQRVEAPARLPAVPQPGNVPSTRFEATGAAEEATAPDATEEASTREENSGVTWWPDTLHGRFDDGFLLETLDDELSLRFHVLSQNDFKVFVPGNQDPARSGLYFPRVRVYFEGDLTRRYQYEVSLQRSVEGVWDLLDANLNVRPSEAFQIRFGRTLVPYSYAWYDHLEQYFIVPERALFPLNFGLSRSAGLLGHGLILDDRIEYAIGGFDGHLAGLADDNTSRDAVGYFNARPFLRSDRFPGLKYLNVGASGFLGQQIAPQGNLPLRTSLQSSENDEAAQHASAQFLKFEENVTGLGSRAGGAVHLAWYARQLSLESEVQYAQIDMARFADHRLTTTAVPVGGGHVTLGYFITGEEVHDRSAVVPLRPFRFLSGTFAPGAVEVYGRYSRLHLGESIFRNELANPLDWTNDVNMTDIGFNWYLNRFVKVYFDWQHAMFGSPVLINSEQGIRSRMNDLLWIRCQIYF